MEFIRDESGETTVEMALLFPVILGLIMFAIGVNMFYEGKIATSVGANEAIRYAATQTSYENAKREANERLKAIYTQHNIKLTKFSLTHIDVNRDGKYSIGDKLVLNIETKKGIWSEYTYELTVRVEDDVIQRGG